MRRGQRESRAQIWDYTNNKVVTKDCPDRCCSFPSVKSLALPSCNPMVSGKGFLEGEQLSRLPGLGGAWGDLGPLVDLPEHSVQYILFGLSF